MSDQDIHTIPKLIIVKSIIYDLIVEGECLYNKFIYEFIMMIYDETRR